MEVQLQSLNTIIRYSPFPRFEEIYPQALNFAEERGFFDDAVMHAHSHTDVSAYHIKYNTDIERNCIGVVMCHHVMGRCQTMVVQFWNTLEDTYKYDSACTFVVSYELGKRGADGGDVKFRNGIQILNMNRAPHWQHEEDFFVLFLTAQIEKKFAFLFEGVEKVNRTVTVLLAESIAYHDVVENVIDHSDNTHEMNDDHKQVFSEWVKLRFPHLMCRFEAVNSAWHECVAWMISKDEAMKRIADRWELEFRPEEWSVAYTLGEFPDPRDLVYLKLHGDDEMEEGHEFCAETDVDKYPLGEPF